MTKQLTRRQILKGLALSGGTIVLAACGAAPAAEAPTTAPAATAAEAATAAPAATAAEAATAAPAAPATVATTGSQVSVTYWGSFSGGLGEAEQAMVNAFNESQSDVMIEYQYQGSYEETAQKFTAALQAGSIPDVLLLSDVWWFKFYLAEAITALDDLATGAGIDFADYEPVLLNEGLRKGQHFWIPFARSTPLFYYNKDVWTEAGLPDRAPETWAEFQEWAPKLAQRDGDTLTRAAFLHPDGASYVAWLFQGVTWQFGGTYSTPEFQITLSDPNTVRAADFYRASVNTDKWALPSSDINKDFIGGTGVAMMASTGGLAGIEKDAPFQVGVGFLPKESNFGCPTGGAGLAIPSAAPAEKQQAAMRFVAFATSPEGTTTWSKSTGYMPVRKSAVASPDMQQFFGERPNFKTAVEQLPLTRAQDAARVFIPNGDQIIGKGLERILIGNEEPSAVWPDVTAELETGAQPVLADLQRIES